MSEEYTNYLGDDLALDFVDPEFFDPPVNTTDPEFSNATSFNSSNPHNFTSIPDPDLSHIFGENLYPHNLADQMKMFRTLMTDSRTLSNDTSSDPLS